MAKKVKKVKSEIDEAAEKAAEEAVLSFSKKQREEEAPDEADMHFADEEMMDATDDEISERDIFIDAFKKAQARGDSVRYYVYKNSAFTTIKDHPYSWEALQKEFKDGHYRIVAKSRKTGQNLMVQSELVGNPSDMHEEEEKTSHNDASPLSTFDYITMMNQVSEKSELKARESSNQTMTMMATMMQAITQSQQSAQQQQQMLFLEMQKQTQLQMQQAQQQAQQANTQMLTLLTSLIQKGPEKPAFDSLQMIKMLDDARSKGKEEERRMFEFLERKVEAAKEEALENAESGEKDESLAKTLLKGFVPVLTQVLQNQPQHGLPGQVQLTPEQAQELRQRQIQAHNEEVLKRQKEADAKRNEIEKRKAMKKAQSVKPEVVHEGGPEKAESQQSRVATNPITDPAIAGPTPEQIKAHNQTVIFDIVKMDIGMAMLSRHNATRTAAKVLKTLATSNISRQNVIETFELNDFMRLASENGVPETDEAKAWITEFYEAIKTSEKSRTSAVPPRRELSDTPARA